ncbi:MAG TPA: M20/M25/M40 family metallo-hydrolase, partial [Kofleriaceae bacterium]|nr:M20/M25/M40 family metallo-hydrolase [Kofleriaceae bacterium]
MKWALVLLTLSGIAHAENSTLSADVAFLASPDLDGRAAGSDGDTKARTYIKKRMTDAGLTTIEQGFEFDKTKSANLVGYIPGDTDDIIIIGAHYDHLGDGHLGANDNASGVAAMLAIADAIKAKGTKPHRTIAFAAWGAEEEGMIGSAFYAAHPPAELPMDKVVQYLNLDMVGSYSSKGFVAAMGSFPKLPARKLLDKLVTHYPKTRVGLGGRAAR